MKNFLILAFAAISFMNCAPGSANPASVTGNHSLNPKNEN